jgi:hypothetical protein
MSTTTTRPLTAQRIAAARTPRELRALCVEHNLEDGGTEHYLRARLTAALPAARAANGPATAVKAVIPQRQDSTPRPTPEHGKVANPVRTASGEVAVYAVEPTAAGLCYQPVSPLVAVRYAMAAVATLEALEAVLDTAAELAEVARARIQAAEKSAKPAPVPQTAKLAPQSVPPAADRVLKAAKAAAKPAKPAATPAPVAAKSAPAPKAATPAGTGGLDAYRRLRARAKELGLSLPRNVSGADLAARVAAAESATNGKPATASPAPKAAPVPAVRGKAAPTVTLEVAADKAAFIRKLAALPVAELAELVKAFAG